MLDRVVVALTLCVLLSTAAGARIPSVNDVYDFIQSNLLHGQDRPGPGGPAFDMGTTSLDWMADSMSMSMNGPPEDHDPVHLVANFYVRPGDKDTYALPVCNEDH
jgi:hypothetical protein